MTQSWAKSTLDVQVHSAGVHALVGDGIDPPTLTALSAMGLDGRGHRAMQFEGFMAVEADLILVAEQFHRDIVMTEVPRALRRTFTLREFARLADRIPSGTPTAVIARAADMRGIDGEVGPSEDDLLDPYRRSDTRAVAMVQAAAVAVRTTLAALGLDRPAATTANRPRPFRVDVRPSPRPTPRPTAPLHESARRPRPRPDGVARSDTVPR